MQKMKAFPETPRPMKAQYVKVDRKYLREKMWAVVDANGEPVAYVVPKGMRDDYIAVEVAAFLNRF